MIRRVALGGALVFSFIHLFAPATAAEPLFESGPSRPLALSPNGARLFAVNTPDHRLEIFDLTGPAPRLFASVPVGLEPIAVSARTNEEVWVVNHLSDSVSIVDVGSVPPRVRRTLHVGDEPGDVVFAGPGRGRAFVTAAHRGQNGIPDPQFFTPGIGRADVWVFDAQNLGDAVGGRPLAVLSLFGDSPRALAVSPDGAIVYAAVFRSGNRTTVVPEGAIPPGSMPPPHTNADGVPAPPTSLIVKHDGAHWRDPSGRIWDHAVRFSLPDKDVFAIDATSNPPREIGSYSGVGTVLYGMAVNPVTGRVYVANTEARNEIRFEGPGTFAGGSLRGRAVENRITVLGPDGVRPRDLNPHVKGNPAPSPPLGRARSLALPVGMAISSDGATMYLAAYGSGKVEAIDLGALESGEFSPRLFRAFFAPDAGPAGVALDEARGRLYVATRFDNALRTYRLADRREIARVSLHHAEPPEVVLGRKIFYDARGSSGHGDASCASCHVFGDTDALSWDLGNPDGKMLPNPNPFRFPADLDAPDFHPMKGPLSTQTLRSLPGQGPLHWRGDRTGGNLPGGDPMDVRAGLGQFSAAFDSLLGRGAPIDAPKMDALSEFLLRLASPPNPVRSLDNSLTPVQARGRDHFLASRTSGAGPCVACHRIDPAKGQAGTDGMSSFDGFPQLYKIAPLRAAYTKVGMFGMPEIPLVRASDPGHTGDQIRGFGFSTDGAFDTLLRFQRAVVFTFSGGDAQRREIAEFLLAFDSDFAPIVGQQATLRGDSAPDAHARVDLLLARAATGECDVVVHGNVRGEPRGWTRTRFGFFRPDRAGEPVLSERDLRALARVRGQEMTYTAVPPGSGIRLGIDRDRDGFLDADELDARSDAADPKSTPYDRDGDGAANDVDCAPDDPGSFATPSEIPDLRVRREPWGSVVVSWTSPSPVAGAATVSDLVSGGLAELRADGGPTRGACVAPGLSEPSWNDPRPAPASAGGDWYLARGRNACGNGTYGRTSRGIERVPPPCP